MQLYADLARELTGDAAERPAQRTTRDIVKESDDRPHDAFFRSLGPVIALNPASEGRRIGG